MEFYKLSIFFQECILLWVTYQGWNKINKMKVVLCIVLLFGGFLMILTWHPTFFGAFPYGYTSGSGTHFFTIVTLLLMDMHRFCGVPTKKQGWILSLISLCLTIISVRNELDFYKAG